MEIGGIVTKTRTSLETVRALHQTIVALRAALEQSKSEIIELKARPWPLVENSNVEDSIRNLPVENGVLKTQVADNKSGETKELELVQKNPREKSEEANRNEVNQEGVCNKARNYPQKQTVIVNKEANNKSKAEKKKSKNPHIRKNHSKKTASANNNNKKVKKLKTKLETKILIKSTQNKNLSTSLESLTILKQPKNNLTISKTFTFSQNLTNLVTKFNSSDTKSVEMSGNKLNETLLNSTESPPPITTNNSQQNDLLEQDQEVDDIELIFTTDETKDSDFKEQLVSIEAGESTNNNQGNLLQCPVPDLDHNLDLSDRELDDDVFNDNFENENQENSNYQSYDLKRENSQLYNSKSDNSLNQEEKSLKSSYSYQDSSFENKSLEKDESFDRFEESRIRIIETDISKCGIQDVEYVASRRNTCPNPLQYRPLLHREALGNKGRRTRPILAHSNAIRKDSGAQTDISALPGSAWLSESNLANKVRLGENFPTLPSKFPLPGSRLHLSEKTLEARRVLLSDIGFTSMVPELSRSADHLCPGNVNKPPPVTTYGQFLKTGDYNSPAYTSQRFTWTTTTATPSECSYSQSRYNSLYPLPSPPAPSRRCSAPVSPSRRCLIKTAPSKVRFANGSLPELRGDWTLTIDSGDSTDSLVDEAENYLRRSIDCLMTSRDRVVYSEGKKTVPRRASAPESSGDNIPPQGWQPFLPRVSRDLKPDHWVKVITPEGRVKGGRVRYVGPVVSQNDHFVGVQLATPDGHSDGTYSNRRYFQCEPYHGIFVPFKKVIMGWRP